MTRRWPWDERYRIWSLLEMLEAFKAGDFASSFANLERASSYSELILNPPHPNLSKAGLLRSAIGPYRDATAEILKLCDAGSVPLSFAVEMQLKRFLEEARRDDVDYAAL